MWVKSLLLETETLHTITNNNIHTLHSIAHVTNTRWRGIVVKAASSAGVLSLSCARLVAGRVTSLWVKRPLSVSQQGPLSLPSLRGRLNE